MTSRDLTRKQVHRLLREAQRQLDYYDRAWRRCQANDVPLDDPLATGVCRTWEALRRWVETLERIRDRLPQPYRPLAKPCKTSGLASKQQPWAQRQREAEEAVARHASRPTPPDPVSAASDTPERYDAAKALPPTTEVHAMPTPEEAARMRAEFEARRRERGKNWPGRHRRG